MLLVERSLTELRICLRVFEDLWFIFVGVSLHGCSSIGFACGLIGMGTYLLARLC